MVKRKINKKELIKNIVIFVSTVVIILTFMHFFRFPNVKGRSMEPTYFNGNKVVTLYTTNVKVNDIAIIWCEYLDEYIVKRVVGTEGDHIEIKNGHLYRNGNLIYESYILEQNWFTEMDYVDVVVPDNEIFVMGDNRCNSSDSRMFGTLKTSDIFGKVLTVLWK